MDDSIIQRAKVGDQLAFQQLIEQYNVMAWRTAQVLLIDRSAIEDVMQDAWLDVWRGLPGFQQGRPFRPWLLTIVANRCRMTIRRSRGLIQALDTAELDEIPSSENALEHVIHLEEDVELHLALEIVSAEQRRVLELRYFADLDLNEIALITSTPLGTVKSRLHRALNSLRLHLKSAEEAHKETKL